MVLKNNSACFECGEPYLTKTQRSSPTHNQTTYYTGKCMMCKETKGVTDIRAFNGLRKLPIDIESYHGGKILRNEIVLCDITFDRVLGKNKKETITLPNVVYKYNKGLFKSIRLLAKYNLEGHTVKVLGIKVIERMGFGKE